MRNPNRVKAGKAVAAARLPKLCLYCRQPFAGTHKQRYCCRPCKEDAARARRQPAGCATCGQPIAARKGQKYCSLTCKRRGRRKPPRMLACGFCAQSFDAVVGKKNKYCSPACRTRSESVARLTGRTGTAAVRVAALERKLTDGQK